MCSAAGGSPALQADVEGGDVLRYAAMCLDNAIELTHWASERPQEEPESQEMPASRSAQNGHVEEDPARPGQAV